MSGCCIISQLSLHDLYLRQMYLHQNCGQIIIICPHTLLWVACSRHSDGVKRVKMANAKGKWGWKKEGLLSLFFFLSLFNFSSVPHHLNAWNRTCCRLVKVYLYETYVWFFRVMLSCHSYPFLFPLYGLPSIFMEQQKLKFCFNFLKKKERWALNKF